MAKGARWVTAALLIVGVLNYGYALLLTHLLNVSSYSRFAAGQGLVLWASTVATVSVPWLLAQALARAQSDAERNAATRFAKLASAGTGVIAAAVVGIIALRFADGALALAAAVSTFIVFLGTTTKGWLQGNERMRVLSILSVAENMVKNVAGVLLVMVAGLGDTGALAAFGIGGIVILSWWPRTPRGTGRSWLAALGDRDLWRRALGMTGTQGAVALFVAIDVVLVALLPGERALAASYQASAALSRVPVYVAAAVGTAFFPSLSRYAVGGMIAARAVRMYAAVAVPVAVVLATVPPSLLGKVFPAQYGTMATLLKFTALTGLAAGGISLVTAFFQATDDYSCLWWLGAGLAGYIGALLAGWRVDGITGLAVGGAVGATAALVLAGYRLVRRHGREVLARTPLAEPVIGAGILLVLRPHMLLWLAAATAVGLRAAVRFVRPGARHAGRPRWAAARNQKTREQSPVSLLIDTMWRGTVPEATHTDLHNALDLARRNRVEGRLALAYPTRLPDVLTEARSVASLFTSHLHQAVGCLRRTGIPAALITVGRPGDHVSTSIDLVVPSYYWRNALAALADRCVHSATHRVERSKVAVLDPTAAVGPVVRLYDSVTWSDAPTFHTDRLLTFAHMDRRGFLIPEPADYLRIQLARILSQDLALDLSVLLAVCNLLNPRVIAAAGEEASREGWRTGFDCALEAVSGTIDRLDRGLSVSLPLQPPVSGSLREETYAGHWRRTRIQGFADNESTPVLSYSAQKQRVVS